MITLTIQTASVRTPFPSQYPITPITSPKKCLAAPCLPCLTIPPLSPSFLPSHVIPKFVSYQPSNLGFTRHGTPSRPTGLACLMTNLPTYAHKRMYVGKSHIGERWTDILGWAWGEVVIDKKGYGRFPVGPRSVAVWVDRRARGRQALEALTL
jgi:hypothetical protein